MPRALTEQEKDRQYKKLLEKGVEAILSYGIRKVSIDDITKAANMAKGTFYHHFDSKEKFMIEVIIGLHRQIFARAEQILLDEQNLRDNIKGFMLKLFHMPEMIFFIKHYSEINELVDTLSDQEARATDQIEVDMFEKLLTTLGINTLKVKPGVVHNYMHTFYMIMGCDLMIAEDLPETVELIIDSLISYVSGGIQ